MCSHTSQQTLTFRWDYFLEYPPPPKKKTTISEVKVLWGNSVGVTEDKRNVIMCELFINKWKNLCRVYYIGLIIKFPATLSQRRILIPGEII